MTDGRRRYPYGGPFARYLSEPYERPVYAPGYFETPMLTGYESGVAAVYPLLKFLEGYTQAKQAQSAERAAERQNLVNLIATTMGQVEQSDLDADTKRALMAEGMGLIGRLVSEASAKDLQRAKNPVARVFLRVLSGLTGGDLQQKSDPNQVLGYLAKVRSSLVGEAGPEALLPLGMAPTAERPATEAPPAEHLTVKAQAPSVMPAPVGVAPIAEPRLAEAVPAISQPATRPSPPVPVITDEEVTLRVRRMGKNPNIVEHRSQALLDLVQQRISEIGWDKMWREEAKTKLGLLGKIESLPAAYRETIETTLAQLPSRRDIEQIAMAEGIDISGLGPAEAQEQIAIVRAPSGPVIVRGEGLKRAKRVRGRWFDELTQEPIGAEVYPVGDKTTVELVWDQQTQTAIEAYADSGTGRMFSLKGEELPRDRYVPAAVKFEMTPAGKAMTLVVDRFGRVLSHRAEPVDPDQQRAFHQQLAALRAQAGNVQLRRMELEERKTERRMDIQRSFADLISGALLQEFQAMERILQTRPDEVTVRRMREEAARNLVSRIALAAGVVKQQFQTSGMSKEEASEKTREMVFDTLYTLAGVYPDPNQRAVIEGALKALQSQFQGTAGLATEQKLPEAVPYDPGDVLRRGVERRARRFSQFQRTAELPIEQKVPEAVPYDPGDVLRQGVERRTRRFGEPR